MYVGTMFIAKINDRVLLKLVYDKSLDFCNKHMKMHFTNNSIKKDLASAFVCVQKILSES